MDLRDGTRLLSLLEILIGKEYVSVTKIIPGYLLMLVFNSAEGKGPDASSSLEQCQQGLANTGAKQCKCTCADLSAVGTDRLAGDKSRSSGHKLQQLFILLETI